jgi:hypothetical protein
MFENAGYNATTFSLDLSDWDTSSVKSTTSMFSGAGHNATTFSLDISTWNTSNLTTMTNMFKDAGRSATNWSILISKTNGNGIDNDTTCLYGKTNTNYATPDDGRLFTLAP